MKSDVEGGTKKHRPARDQHFSPPSPRRVASSRTLARPGRKTIGDALYIFSRLPCTSCINHPLRHSSVSCTFSNSGPSTQHTYSHRTDNEHTDDAFQEGSQ